MRISVEYRYYTRVNKSILYVFFFLLRAQISSFANQMVRILSEVEMNAVSIERCREYTQINSEVNVSKRVVKSLQL